VNLDGLGTTALGVLDSGSALLAGLGLLAGGSVTHLVVELEVSIVINGDINLLDGETILLLVAGEGSGLLLGDGVLDALAVERALGYMVTFAELVGASPSATELEVSVVEVLLAILEVCPVETFVLLVGALVVVVLGSVVTRGLTVPGGGSDLLGSQTRDEEGNGTLHFASGTCKKS